MGAATYLLWIALGCSAVAVLISVDAWIDRRPGGRKVDEQLEYLRAYERYLAALERQQKRHIRIGHKERETTNDR